jgi:hypothetical protein
MKTYEKVRLQVHVFVTEALRRLSGQVFLSRSYTSGENTYGTRRIGGCVDATARVNILEKMRKKSLVPFRESTHNSIDIQM